MRLNRICKNKMILCCFLALFASAAQADNDWIRKPVDWSGPNQSKIKAVHYPEYNNQLIAGEWLSVSQQSLVKPQGDVLATVIDSPPIDGFVPYVAINVTNERADEYDGKFNATVELQVEGNYLTNNPATSYAIGLFDTGASASIISAADAETIGIYDYPDMVSSYPVVLIGVNDTALAYVSQPMGLFVGGLRNIDPNGELSDANMVGLSNVTIAIGDPIDSPNVPTIAGVPMAVYYNTVFDNSNPITIDVNNQQYTAPDIQILDSNSPIPDYHNMIPLELRPLASTVVQYFYTIDPDDPWGLEVIPTSPSVIMGASSQSLFFVSSVDLYQGERYAYDRDRFMLDTGAQVTVIGSRVAARLELDPQDTEFQVEIKGATGEIQMIDGFYIDKLEIPALGQWLTFTNVPVILLDVASPEGGALDGIIGMNLFTQLDFVLKGGGMMLQDDPSLTFQMLESNIADFNQDRNVNFYDFSLFASAWQTQPPQLAYDSIFDISNPPDGVINLADLTIFAENWLAK